MNKPAIACYWTSREAKIDEEGRIGLAFNREHVSEVAADAENIIKGAAPVEQIIY